MAWERCMFSRFRNRDSAITFDVGSAGIRAVQVTTHGVGLEARDSLALDLLPRKRTPATALPPPDYQRIARLAGQGRFVGNDVALVLSPPDVSFCALRLPQKALGQPPDRLREALAWEVAREIRAEANELEVRYWTLPPGHRQGVNIMAVALQAKRATEWFDLLSAGGLSLRRLDVSPCTLVALGRRKVGPQEDELWGVLDLGLQRATLTVVLGETPVYTRSLSIASDTWTQRLASGFEVPLGNAEQIKRDNGIGAAACSIQTTADDGPPIAVAEDIPAVVFDLLRDSLADLVREINTCYAYVMQNYADAHASRLLLAGGGANLHGLASYLQNELDIAVTRLTNDDDAWDRPVQGARITPTLAAAAGGALCDVEGA